MGHISHVLLYFSKSCKIALVRKSAAHSPDSRAVQSYTHTGRKDEETHPDRHRRVPVVLRLHPTRGRGQQRGRRRRYGTRRGRQFVDIHRGARWHNHRHPRGAGHSRLSRPQKMSRRLAGGQPEGVRPFSPPGCPLITPFTSPEEAVFICQF